MAWNEPGPGRDPWNQGGKRGEPGPDLDALLKRLKQRFGGRGGKPFGTVGLVVAALLVLWSQTGWYVVDEQERAVVLRLGRFVGITDPGPHWHLPWPLETTEIVNVTGVRTAREQATMLTRDENIVDLELTVQYRVQADKVYDFVFSVSDPDETLQQATKSAVREVVGRSGMDDVLTDGRQAVADQTKQLLQEQLDRYQTGIIVTEVNLQQAQPPEDVQASFADAIKAREDQQRARNEAEAYKNDRLPRAGGAAARLVAEATAYRDQVVSRAEGDASRFSALLTEYRKAPQVTRERLYLDAMSSILSSNAKVLIDVDKGGPMFYLPLDELLKNARSFDGNPDAAGSGSGAARSGSSSAPDASRSRERSR